MIARLLVCFAAIAALSGGAARGETILWNITPVAEDGRVVRLDLSLSFPGDADGETVLALPQDWGGEPELWRALWDFRADGAAIAPATDTTQLILTHEPGAQIRLDWKAGGGPDSPPGRSAPGNDYRARFLPDYFFVIGHTVLPLPDHLPEDAPARAVIARPEGVTLVSDLEHSSGKSLPLSDLAQSTLFGGNIRLIKNGRARLALAGRFDELDDAFWQDTFTRIAASQRKYWKSKDEAFLVTVIGREGSPGAYSLGGTGLGDGFAIFGTQNIRAGDVAPLIAHEMMHTWVPGRIGEMPEGEAEISHYWLSEGFTEWATHRVLVREGIWSPQDFAAGFNAAARAYDLSPARDADAAAIMAGFWSDAETNKVPYRKGMLIAVWLDSQVRERTKGRRDLDDVLLRMQRDAKKDKTVLARDLLVRSVKKLTGWDPSADLDAMALNAAGVPLTEAVFAPCGKLTVTETAVWERGFDLVATQAAGQIVTGVTEGSGAYTAGLRNGMTLKEWSEDSRRRDTTKEVTARISDAEGERAISWLPVAPGTRPVRALELDPGLSGKSAEACRKRLAGL